ncbi:MAG: 3'-5' exonuclease [Candidatus Sericytochromatia bacterium]|uniref:3'-5' exonuclease n=1 Tax=Candidatus Tanganyikabacteria bacterium TaxID=2961651 RepID=A0A938BKK1_9BACT|nr:3'-5' exonuclease [Candidatus Tanganyikabacteria bacterium]
MTGIVTVVDLETTGLDYKLDRILEIGAVRLIDGDVAGEFHALVNPEVPLRESNIAIHGITAEMVRGCPKIRSVLPAFIEFLADTPLVAHNAVFDFNFLNQNAKLLLGLDLTNQMIDSGALAKEVFPRERALSLERLLQLMGKPVDGLHRALTDARALASVFPDLSDLYEAKLAWHRSRFAVADALASRYLQLTDLIDELKAEEWEVRRTLELYFTETQRDAIQVPGGATVKVEKKESWEFHGDEVRSILAEAGILERVTRVDRTKLDRYLKGDRLSQQQKEAILSTRRFLGYRPHLSVERPN